MSEKNSKPKKKQVPRVTIKQIEANRFGIGDFLNLEPDSSGKIPISIARTCLNDSIKEIIKDSKYYHDSGGGFRFSVGTEKIQSDQGDRIANKRGFVLASFLEKLRGDPEATPTLEELLSPYRNHRFHLLMNPIQNSNSNNTSASSSSSTNSAYQPSIASLLQLLPEPVNRLTKNYINDLKRIEKERGKNTFQLPKSGKVATVTLGLNTALQLLSPQQKEKFTELVLEDSNNLSTSVGIFCSCMSLFMLDVARFVPSDRFDEIFDWIYASDTSLRHVVKRLSFLKNLWSGNDQEDIEFPKGLETKELVDRLCKGVQADVLNSFNEKYKKSPPFPRLRDQDLIVQFTTQYIKPNFQLFYQQIGISCVRCQLKYLLLQDPLFINWTQSELSLFVSFLINNLKCVKDNVAAKLVPKFDFNKSQKTIVRILDQYFDLIGASTIYQWVEQPKLIDSTTTPAAVPSRSKTNVNTNVKEFQQSLSCAVRELIQRKYSEIDKSLLQMSRILHGQEEVIVLDPIGVAKTEKKVLAKRSWIGIVKFLKHVSDTTDNIKFKKELTENAIDGMDLDGDGEGVENDGDGEDESGDVQMGDGVDESDGEDDVEDLEEGEEVEEVDDEMEDGDDVNVDEGEEVDEWQEWDEVDEADQMDDEVDEFEEVDQVDEADQMEDDVDDVEEVDQMDDEADQMDDEVDEFEEVDQMDDEADQMEDDVDDVEEVDQVDEADQMEDAMDDVEEADQMEDEMEDDVNDVAEMDDGDDDRDAIGIENIQNVRNMKNAMVERPKPLNKFHKCCPMYNVSPWIEYTQSQAKKLMEEVVQVKGGPKVSISCDSAFVWIYAKQAKKKIHGDCAAQVNFNIVSMK
jgi:hypothetical protein